MACRRRPADHPDQEALDLLAILLGDGRNARLVHRLREEKKIVWSVGASNITQEGPGIFAVFAEFDAPKNDSAVAAGVRAVLRGLRSSPPTESEIHRAKNLMQTSWLQGYETFHNQASTLGAYALEDHLSRACGIILPKILSLRRRDLLERDRSLFASPISPARSSNHECGSLEQWRLENGLTVLYRRDAAFPLTSPPRFFWPWEAVRRSPQEAGLCSMTVDLLMQGTRHRTARQLASVMESVGASMGTQVHEDYAEMGFVVPAAETRPRFWCHGGSPARTRFSEGRDRQGKVPRAGGIVQP